jgi:hypothetical protein
LLSWEAEEAGCRWEERDGESGLDCVHDVDYVDDDLHEENASENGDDI